MSSKKPGRPTKKTQSKKTEVITVLNSDSEDLQEDVKQLAISNTITVSKPKVQTPEQMPEPATVETPSQTSKIPTIDIPPNQLPLPTPPQQTPEEMLDEMVEYLMKESEKQEEENEKLRKENNELRLKYQSVRHRCMLWGTEAEKTLARRFNTADNLNVMKILIHKLKDSFE